MNSSTSSDNSTSPHSALDGWQWDAIKDDYVRIVDPLAGEARETINEAGGAPVQNLSAEDFARLYPPDTFAQNVAGLISFGGHTVGKYKTCDIDGSDPAFAKAMEVAYRRFLAGDNAFVLKLMSSRDLVDLLIVSAWAGPFAKSIAKEGREKAKAKKLAQKEQAKSPLGDPQKTHDPNSSPPPGQARGAVNTADLLGGA